jgi:hypothetical protein
LAETHPWRQNWAGARLISESDISDCGRYAINNAGTIVGTDGFATIWQNGVEQNLNNLIAPNSGLTLYNALGINESGQIVGNGLTSNLTEYAFLLTPIPEPAPTFLLAIGCAAFLPMRARRTKQPKQR